MRLRLIRHTVVGLAVAAAAACGGSAMSPSEVAAPLPDGNFLLLLLGDTIRCNDLKSPQAGTAVAVALTATHDTGGTWIAHSAGGAGGSFEMRLTRGGNVTQGAGGPARPLDVAVTGTLSGTAVDSVSPSPLVFGATLSSAVFGSSVSLSGLIRSPGITTDGMIQSLVTFSRNGVNAQCPSGVVEWDLAPL